MRKLEGVLMHAYDAATDEVMNECEVEVEDRSAAQRRQASSKKGIREAVQSANALC